MNQPDFSRYDEEQLRQVRSRIDAERFPDRMAQIDARLAELANAPPQPPAAAKQPVADRASYLPPMRRAGMMWLALAVATLAFGIWSAPPGAAFSQLNISGIILAAFLMGGSLRVAVVMRWLMSLGVAATVMMVPLIFSQPLDLTLTQLRLAPALYLGTVLLTVAQAALMVYSLRLLGDPAIQAARDLEGRQRFDMRVPFASGVVVGAAMLFFLNGQLWGERGRHAEQLALAQGGPAYRYHAHYIFINYNQNGTFVKANVTAWNEHTVGNVAVNWKE